MILQSHQELIEKRLEQQLTTQSLPSKLQEACKYAMLNGGKRFRPTLSILIAEALNKGIDVTTGALAVEYFHSASLVADDLPCMDDDDIRRNKPSTHKVYGEAMALLTSYALIAAGYGCISSCAEELHHSNAPVDRDPDFLARLVLENATHNTGLEGATGGQFLDIFPPDLTLSTLQEIIHKKTISLFEISFVTGWLFGGGSVEDLPLVKRCASHFGMAFQTADDLDDMEQDLLNGRKINLANVFGKEFAENTLKEEINGYSECLKKLGIDSEELLGLASYFA